MKFTETPLFGAYLVELSPHADERGFFARTWDTEAFSEKGLKTRLVQCSVSFNHQRGTVRGMHYQVKPFEESKLVRCTQGGIYDVIVDMREDSPTYRQWAGYELTAENHRALYIPEGFAHGFQTLSDNTEVFYQIGEAYHPECARGVRWDDPAIAVEWPLPISVIAHKDQQWPFLPGVSET